MRRRAFLGSLAAGAVAAPHLARGAAASTLKFVPAQDLALLDPIQSPSGSTIMHSCLVFDTLYGLDETYKAQPQMVAGHVIEDEGKLWKLTLRDGMNLVAKEYVAAQDPDNPGVLVLSQFAGAARELDAALVVNPYDEVGVASALDRGLAMPLDERRERHAAMLGVMRRHSLDTWRDGFEADLRGCGA